MISINLKNVTKLFVFALAVFFSIASTDVLSQNNKYTLVIDAGHGGHDPGAVGKFAREKDINLSVALYLGELIATNFSDVKVIYTRTTDKYLTLHERANIVNTNQADLFISIHTNSATNSSAYGTETFTLGLAKTKGNLDVAMRENSVILLEDDYKTKYKGFDPRSVDSYIMFEFMQDKYIDKSVSFAQDIQYYFKNHADRIDRGVRQAGFWVLFQSACPSVLVELGFISNAAEEKYLASQLGTKQLAESIYKAFVNLKYEHDKKYGKTTTRKNTFSETASIRVDDVGRFDKRSNADASAPLKPVVANTSTAVVQPKDKVIPAIEDTLETNASANKATKKTDAKKSDKKAGNTKVSSSEKRKEEKNPTVDTTMHQRIAQQPMAGNQINNDDRTESIEQIKTSSTSTGQQIKNKIDPTETKSAKPKQLSPEKEKFVDMAAYAQATERPIFKLQLFSSPKKLNSNAADFRGIRNADFYVENGLYKYTLGADSQYEVIAKLRREMLQLFPDAFIVAFLGKNKITVAQAQKLTLKKK